MPLVIFPAILRLWKYSARIIKTIEIIAVKGNEILFPAGADLIPVGIVAVGNLGGRFIFSAFFVIIFTTPPIASAPYKTELGPLMTSIFSTASIGTPLVEE